MTNGETAVLTEDLQAPGRLFLPAMILSYAGAMLPGLILNVTLIDIGNTFSVSEAATAQLFTAASLVAVLTALLMGAWSVRYPHRSLLLTGLLFINLAAAGSFLAPNFLMMLFLYALFGLGTGMSYSMTLALIGGHVPLTKRTRAIGLFNGGRILVAVIAGSVTGFIVGASGEGGWRWPFLGLLLPIALLSFGLTGKETPAPIQSRPQESNKTYWSGFQAIFTNRSATVCLIGAGLLTAGFQSMFLYYSSFLRNRLSVSVEGAALLLTASGVVGALGGYIGGRIILRFGRKRFTVVMALLQGLFISTYMLPSTLWLAVGISYLASICTGMRMTAVPSLALEQVPQFRGSMMSLNAAAQALGGALGAGVGGLALLLGDFEGLGLTLGALCFVAALLFHFLAVDPTDEPHMGG